MAGYSGTPLPKKLGIKPQFRVLLLDVSADVSAELKDALAGCHLLKHGSGPLDFALVFAGTSADLQKKFGKVARQLAPAGMLWIGWPKKASGLSTDLNENEVRRIGLQAGLVDVKVCAIDKTWSGLKFVIRLKDRANN